MPQYDIRCCSCGRVRLDVVVREVMPFGEERALVEPARTDAGVVDAPMTCDGCGGERWERAEPAHLCARTTREWAIGCWGDRRG